jgi:hypothetical protein
MSLYPRLFPGLAALFVAAFTSTLSYSQTAPPPAPPQAPTSSPDAQPTPAAPPKTSASPLTNDQVKPPEDPKILEDGGLSIEPIYWLNKAQPALKGGAQTFGDENLNFYGSAKASIGAELGIPAGHSNTLRFSYFRVQGNSTSTISNDETYFNQAYSAGDLLVSNYKIQSAKVSWDYLSYTWYRHKIRFKTLYEMQYVNISSNQSAPLVPETTDSSGNTNLNTSYGSKQLFLPTFGVEFEQPLNKHVRWMAKASGFGIPKKADIWDTQAEIAFRVNSLEVLVGGRAYHFKTSPGSTEYFYDTLDGAYVGIRYYLGQSRR